MADIVVESLLSFGVEKLWDLLVRETDRLKGVDEQLTDLKRDLKSLRSFLKDADAKKHANASVKNWVEEIKAVVFDTEDIIETFLVKEELSKSSSIKKRMRRLSCIILDRRELASDLEGISKRISKLIGNMKPILEQQMIFTGSQDPHLLQERQREMRKTYPTNNENDLVGLEKNVKNLVGYLVEEDNIQVVSITGMGGIGKTTLARQVFNHEMVNSHFDGVAWVCISLQFTKKYVWQTILQKLSSKHDEHLVSNMSEDELQGKLFSLLETSKSLIILDDMWKEEDWDRIKPVFPSKKGWKVLLTSRNERVGLHVDPRCFTFKPECLTFEESWTLFQRIAFPRRDTTEVKVDVEKEEMGKKMIKHCGGLPLAVKVLGGLLAAQHTLSEWNRLCENNGSHIIGGTSFNDRNISSVYQILYLSFEELPRYLKHCFLYLAHFPEDYSIDIENLSNYWAAEVIPRPRYYNGATTREVAYGYLEELVKRNMVISQRDAITSRFETFQLHDMIREVCLLKAEEENFVHIVDTANSQSPCKSRRIAVDRRDELYDPNGMAKNTKLRSLLFFRGQLFSEGWMPSKLFFTRLQLLRVLDLSYANFKGEKLPSSIGKLIHLRYLSFYKANLSHLPSSLQNLKLLLYLNMLVSSSFPLYIPNNVLTEMRELTYLQLPEEINGKVKMKLGSLFNLETLAYFSTKHSSVTDLHKMTRLETLKIIFNGGCTMKTLSSYLRELGRLKNLTIHNFDPKNDEGGFVLDCVHLEQLSLRIYMPTLPDEQHFPCHLTTITLTECLLEEDPMPILEKLLQLKEVSLCFQSFNGRRMVCSGGGFPQLQKLQLFGLNNWEEWIVEEGSMSLLLFLTIRGCQMLRELPDGLKFIISLKELTIYTNHLDFKKKLQRGGKDNYKVQHIPLVQIF